MDKVKEGKQLIKPHRLGEIGTIYGGKLNLVTSESVFSSLMGRRGMKCLQGYAERGVGSHLDKRQNNSDGQNTLLAMISGIKK